MGEQKEQTNHAEQEKKTEQKTEQKQKAEWAKRIAQIKKSVGQVKKVIKTVTEYAEKAWDAAEESMDLTGAMNHLGSQMDKIGNTFAKDYKKYGYASAEGYAKSFKERIDKLNTQMTGYGMDGENATGLPKDAGLGIDPRQLAEFQVKIGSIAEASGMAGENILTMQKAMSMLSVDLASFSAVDTDQVMTDLTNALNGQSGALERYGIQLSDAMLNQYAYAAGAGALSASMTQQQQMQLRMLGILEQSSFAWGDQISKINSAASQYRIFQQQMTGLTQVIGNLFLPVAQAVLPVVNGMLIALNRVLTAIGFSAWGDNWLTDISASVGGGIGNVEKLTESIDKTENGLKDASAEAKRLRNYLMGIDELNVMEPEGSSNGNGHGNNSSSSGINFDFIGDSFDNYESVWDTALSGMKNKAQIFADEVGKILTPLSAVFENLFNGDFFGAGKETSNLVSGIFTWIADAIDKVDWNGLGYKIGEFLAGIDWENILKAVAKVIWKGLKAAMELCSGIFSAAPVENGILAAMFFLDYTGIGNRVAKKIWESISGKLKENIALLTKGGFWNNIGYVFEAKFSGATLKEAMETGFGKAGSSFAGWGLVITGVTTAFGNFFKMLKDGFSWLNEILMVVGIAIAAVGAVILGVVSGGIAAIVAAIVAAVATIVILVHDNWEAICEWFSGIGKQFRTNIVDPVVNNFKDLWKMICEVWDSAPEWFDSEVITPLSNLFGGLWEGFELMVSHSVNVIVGIVESVLNFLINCVNGIIKGFNKVVTWAAGIVGVEWGGVDLIPNISPTPINAYAVGGFPQRGDFFLANENGIPELIGTIGGKPAVASNMEITGISDAIYTTGEENGNLIRTAIDLLQLISQKNMDVNIGDKAIQQASMRGKKRMGMSIITT